ncbi:RodZ domain-containing protein [Shewanella decolorationis]|uniref:RodZ domain-containing protein n=1 Tax=Shewanella decolorationis TaxID=256839 RepID=UPI001056E509|nr:RodZ domain-containing protein [Shewanella decolorationis]
MKDNEINASVEPVTASEAESTPDVTLGTVLRTAREQMGLSIADTAVKLHLRPGIVENLEADDFSNISSSTYVRGYVKNYARMLGVDNTLIEACLARQVPLVTQPAMQSFSRKTTYQARDTKLKWLSFFIVLVLLGLFVLWWMQRSTLVTHVDISKPTAEELAAANQALPGDVLLTETDASALLSEIAVNGSMATDGPVKDTDESTIDPNMNDMAAMEAEQTSANSAVNASESNNVLTNNPSNTAPNLAASNAVAVPSATQNAATNTAPVQSQTASNAPAANTASTAQAMPVTAGLSSITIELTGDCWINIVDAKGKAIVDGVRGAGANIQASGVPPFKVILGAPTVVSTFTVDGKAISLAEFPKGRVARLTIPQV